MTAETIGEAQVTITADFSTFDDQLRAKLVAAATKAGNDAEKVLKRSGSNAGKGFSDGVSKAASSQKTLDGIRGSVERLEAATVRARDAQIDSANKVSRAEAALAKVKRETSIVTIDGAEKIIAAEQRVAKAKRDSARADATALSATKALSSARSKLAVEGARAGDTFGIELRKAVERSAGKAGDDGGNFFSRAFRTAASRGIGKALFSTLIVSAGSLAAALSPLPTILGGTTAAAVALVSALAAAAPAAISLAGVLGALGLAAGALVVGFSGVSDAMKLQSKAAAELAATGKVSTATQEKLNTALKNLAPSARAVVKELGAMRPAWEAVTKSVQQRLFDGVAHSLQQLGNTFFPILTKQLGTAAGNLSLFTRGLVDFLTRGNRANQVNTIFTGLNGILKTLLQAVNPLVAGFLDIFTASLPFAQQLATALRNIGTQFGVWLQKVADGSGFQTFMQTAMTLAGNLFKLLGNIGSILGSVFAAGTQTGGNLLSLLVNITGQFSAFLKTAAGQQALQQFFGLAAQAGQTLLGIFQTLSPLLAGIGSLFSALKPAIATLGAALTPVIAALAQTLGAGLAQLGPVIAGLVTAIAPLAAQLGTALVGALQTLLPSVAQLVAGLTPLVTSILNVAVTLIQQLLSALLPLVPVIVQVATTIAAGLTPIIQSLVPVIQQAGANLASLVQAILPLVPTLLQLIPPALQLVGALVQIVVALQPLTTTILTAFIQLLVQLTPAIQAVVPLMVSLTTATARGAAIFAQILSAVVRFVDGAISKFVQIRSQGITLISGLISGAVALFLSLSGKVASAMAAFANAVRSKVDQVASFFRTLPGRVVSAISGLGSALFTAGSQAVQGLVNGITSKAGAVLKAAQDLAGKVKAGIGGALKIFSPSRVTFAQGAFAGQGLANGLLNKVRTVERAATTLANAVPAAIGKALTKVNSSLISLSNSLPAGAKRRIDAVVSAGQKQFDALAKSSTVLDTKLKAAQSNLQALLQKSQQFSQQVASSILQTGNIAQGQNTTFAGIVAGLRQAVTNAKQFGATIAALTKAGLNKTSLQQIIDAGPEAGTAAGKAVLAAGKAGVNQINTLQAQLQAAANKTAKQATDAIFGQGLAIAQGIVAGLQKQKASLDQQMLRLADVLVARVIAVLKALNIPGVKSLKIPGLKDGGVVQGRGAAGTLIRAGEYGKKEAVIPLTKPQRARELMDATGLSKLVAGGSNGSSRTVEVPVHVHGNVVDYDALREFFENILRQHGLVPRIGIVTSGGML